MGGANVAKQHLSGTEAQIARQTLADSIGVHAIAYPKNIELAGSDPLTHARLAALQTTSGTNSASQRRRR